MGETTLDCGRRFRSRWDRVLALLLSFILVASPLFADAKPSRRTLLRAKRLYTKGKAAFELGHFDKALRYYGKAYELSGKAGLLFNIGQCHRNLGANDLGHLEKAVFSFQLYLKKQPRARNRPAVEALIRTLNRRIADTKAELERKRLAAEQRRREADERRRQAEERRRRAEQQRFGDKPGPIVKTTPFYATWWFWTLVGVAVAGGAVGTYFGVSGGGSSLPDSPFPPARL
jgi:tetratricopeptide (TPR) repeat protein